MSAREIDSLRFLFKGTPEGVIQALKKAFMKNTVCPARQGEPNILKSTSEKTDEHLGTWGPVFVLHFKNMSMWRPKQ